MHTQMPFSCQPVGVSVCAKDSLDFGEEMGGQSQVCNFQQCLFTKGDNSLRVYLFYTFKWVYFKPLK